MSQEEKENSSVAESQEEQLTAENRDIKLEQGQDSEQKLVNKSEAAASDKFKSSSLDEKALNEEILKKLGITNDKKNSDNRQTNLNSDDAQFQQNRQQVQAVQVENQIKTALSHDFEKIQKMMQFGLVNPEQGQNLKKQVLKKAFDTLVQAGKVNQCNSFSPQNGSMISESSSASSDLDKNNYNFFDSEGRKEVLNYLRSANNSLGQDELSKISEIVKIVEKSAIERSLKTTAHEEVILNSNENAKRRLTANAQKSSRSEGLSRTFTREQIGKMSSAEFTKYEPFIMEQLKKGQIK